MPGVVRVLQHFDDADSMLIVRRVSRRASSADQAYEAEHIGMTLDEGPIEPVRFIVEAVGVGDGLAVVMVGPQMGQGIPYRSSKTVDLGSTQITEKSDRTLPFSPLLGTLALLSGVGVLLVAVKRK